MNSLHSILLASGSPRRRELLKQLAVTFTVAAMDVDESVIPGEAPRDYVVRLAREKALAGYQQSGGVVPALGSDTIVLLEGKILCKPESRAEAESMLQSLSGRTHHVYSAVALALAADKVIDTLNITAVTFGEMPAEWVLKFNDFNTDVTIQSPLE